MTGSLVYLLHFDRLYMPYPDAPPGTCAGHYLGSTYDLPGRLGAHERGEGARLLAVVRAAGVGWTLARTWPGGRARERQIKQMGGLSRRCPLCGIKPRRDRRPR